MINLPYSFYVRESDIVYSIDMLYIQGFLTCSTRFFCNLLESVCESHKSFKGRCSYSWYQDMYLFNGITIYCGLFNDYDVVNKSWSILPCAEIRFNPNKHNENDIVKLYFDNVVDTLIRKFDFACDIPCKPSCIIVDSKRKFSSLNNGETRYYGAFGGDYHCKIYNKSKELFDSKVIDKDTFLYNDLTRIELTIKTNQLDNFTRDKFYLLSSIPEFQGLNDTEKCILDLYYRLKSYESDLSFNDLKLGRKMFGKLKPFLMQDNNLLSINSDYCRMLLNKVCYKYNCIY